MSATGYSFLEPRHDYKSGLGWSRKVDVCGTEYLVGVERGKPVRIAYKPRGQNRGYWWYGFVRTSDGRTIWTDGEPKSIGVRGILRDAGIICRRCGLPPRLHIPTGGACLPGFGRD